MHTTIQTFESELSVSIFKQAYGRWYHMNTAVPSPHFLFLGFVCIKLCSRLSNRHSPIRHSKVSGHGLLSTNTTTSLRLRTSRTKKDTNIQHTGNALDKPCQGLDLPHAVLSTAVLAGGDVRLGKEGLEGSVDDEEVLVAFEGAFLGACTEADEGLDAAEFFEFVEDAACGDGGDFDGDVFPV